VFVCHSTSPFASRSLRLLPTLSPASSSRCAPVLALLAVVWRVLDDDAALVAGGPGDLPGPDSSSRLPSQMVETSTISCDMLEARMDPMATWMSPSEL